MRNGGKLQKIITIWIIALYTIEALSINMSKQKEENLKNVQLEKALETTKDIPYLLSIEKPTDNKEKIEFKSINTTNKTFKTLIEECNNTIEKYNTNNISTDELKYSIKNAEDVFIDNIKNISNSKDNNTMKLADIIYFENKIIAIYTNECEEIKIIGAINSKREAKLKLPYSIINTETEKSSTIKTFEENELVEMFNKFNSNVYIENYISSINKNNKLTEDKYLENLGKGIHYIIQNEHNEENCLCNYIDSNSNKLCNYIISILKNNKKLEFIDIGKSSTGLDYKDRVILQVSRSSSLNSTSKDKQTAYTTIILKLNKQYKIYDVDIV